MPGRYYRRRVRKNVMNSYVPVYIEPQALVKRTGECDLVKVHEYFYYILDVIMEQFNYTEALAGLNDIVEAITSKIEYHNILEKIENNLLSVTENIINGASPHIIKCRIDYIKRYIDELPPSCQDLGPVSDMILQLIDYMITESDFNVIRNDINEVRSFLTETFPNIMVINEVQDKLLEIICNISERTNPKIIEMRLCYIQNLIKQIHLSD